jgi:hypothetical protein
MTNTNEKMKSLATPTLNTAILRGIAEKLERVSADRLNDEGKEALKQIEKALDDLRFQIVALKMIEELELIESVRGM